jgi:hypothetical protein
LTCGRPAAPAARARWTGHAATVLAAVGLLLAIGPAGAEDGAALERAVKATFLYKFELYVTWPDRVFAAPASPFNLCIVGVDPFGALIDRAVSGQMVGLHPITILRVPRFSAADHCALLYVATDDAAAARRDLAAARGLPVLTVTDTADEDAKGLINFVIVDNRVRFEIDNAASVQDGLTISSKLLSIAVNVRGGP